MRAAVVAVLAAAPGGAGAAEPGNAKRPAAAPRTVPEWWSLVRTGPPGDFPLIPASTLVYNVSWNGVLKAGETRLVFLPAAEGKGAVAAADPFIRTVATSRSVGAARMLWPYDARVDSAVRAAGFLPEVVSQWEEDRAEENVYRTTFTPGLVMNEWTTRPKKAGETEEQRQRAFPLEPVHDLVSSMLYLRSFAWETPGEDLTVIVFPFRDPYLATATFVGRERRKVEKKETDVLRFGLRLSKIEKDGSLKPIDKQMKSAHFWLTDDALRLPLELRAEVFIGDIRVVLDDYDPLPEAARRAVPRDADAEAVLAAAALRPAVRFALPAVGKGRGKGKEAAEAEPEADRARGVEAKRTKR
jgi:hypothetical protein